MCAGVAELSERWTVDLEMRPIQVRTRQKYFAFIFIRLRRLKLLLFVGNSVGIKNLLNVGKPEDVFRPEVATNLQLNRMFPPLFII